MRREARSTASQSQTLRFLWPTNVHTSSSSSTSGFFRCAFFEHRRRRRGDARAAFFYQFGDGHARDACGPHDAALGVALGEQDLDLGVLCCLGHRRWHKPRLIPARFALILRLAALRAVAANVFAATAGAEVVRVNHALNLRLHSLIDHHPGIKVFHLFTITIVNVSKETKHLSNISIELKRHKQKTLVTLSDAFANTDFSNKAEPSQSFKQYARYEYSHLPGKPAEEVDMALFDEYRVIIEDSHNNTFKSKWVKSELYFNRKTVLWKHAKSDSLLI